jgi:hypothetical protein
MAGQHERAGSRQQPAEPVKIARHALAITGTDFVVAPDDPGTAMGASAREFCNLILDLRPAERAEEEPSPASNTTMGVPVPQQSICICLPSDADQLAGRRKNANSSVAFELFPNRPDHE